MKNTIGRINETAQINFEKAKGMLDMFNDFYNTNYSWLNKRVVLKTENNTYHDVYTSLKDKNLQNNKTQVRSYDYTTINTMVKNFTNDYDAYFEYDDKTGEFFGNC